MSTMAHEAFSHVTVASPADLRAAIRNAEKRSGFTYDQLAEQARTGRYESFRARLAWVAVGGLRDLLDAR